jgi:hypothetical protein
VETGHALCALTMRSPRAARAHAGAVMRSMVARWGLAGGKVLPVSTGGVPRWRRARRSAARRGGGIGMARCGGGGAGTVVTDDGALALHHGEGESEVRWGRD